MLIQTDTHTQRADCTTWTTIVVRKREKPSTVMDTMVRNSTDLSIIAASDDVRRRDRSTISIYFNLFSRSHQLKHHKTHNNKTDDAT